MLAVLFIADSAHIFDSVCATTIVRTTTLASSSTQPVLCTGRTTQAEGCPGLFGRPGVSAFRIRKEGQWGGKGIEFDC